MQDRDCVVLYGLPARSPFMVVVALSPKRISAAFLATVGTNRRAAFSDSSMLRGEPMSEFESTCAIWQ
jgi:hypothetical protein